MLTKYVLPGHKMEIQKIEPKSGRGGATGLAAAATQKKPLYVTKIYQIISDERFEVLMPMEQFKLILLPVGAEYDLCFVTPSGFFQCFGRVVDRYKDKNVYLLLMERTSNLRKQQRREFYRFSCVLDMGSRPISPEEVEEIDTKGADFTPGMLLQRSVVVDISGGGLRFVANFSYEPGMLILCCYTLNIDGRSKVFNLVGKVLSIREVDGRPGVHEHRVQYVDIDKNDREEIIRFIFEEERKNRRKERWGSEE